MRYAYIPSATAARWTQWVLSVIVALVMVCVPGAVMAQDGQAPPGSPALAPANPGAAASPAAPPANNATPSPLETLEPNAFPEGLEVVEVRVLDLH